MVPRVAARTASIRVLLRSYEAEIGRPVQHLAVCDASYGIGVLRWADQRAFFLGRSGFPAITAETIRATTRAFIEEALGVEGDDQLT
jgi:hypothetical protein